MQKQPTSKIHPSLYFYSWASPYTLCRTYRFSHRLAPEHSGTHRDSHEIVPPLLVHWPLAMVEQVTWFCHQASALPLAIAVSMLVTGSWNHSYKWPNLHGHSN